MWQFKKDKTEWTEKDLKEWNKNQYGTDDDGNIGKAAHQARNDYQDSGSPFGDLDNRDRSSKVDTKADD